MIDIKQYLEDCADIVTKIRNGVPREDLGFPVSAEYYNAMLLMIENHDRNDILAKRFGIPIEKLKEDKNDI